MTMNFGVTDGETIISTRYINSDSEEPPSLYYKKYNDNIIISSEPIEIYTMYAIPCRFANSQ